MTLWRSLFLVMLAGWLSGCGINNIPTYDEQVKAAWSQVENQYQRRADLIPNLVNTVKGYASHEREVLVDVTEARAKVGSIQVDGSMLENPEKLKQFEQAQRQALQSQLEGTENRISVARRDYIAAVQQYNTEIRTFPGRLWHSFLYSDMEMRDTYEATAEDADQAPAVNFN